jgi:hypothetical protein
MTINFRLALLEIAQGIGREIRSDDMTYPRLLDVLGELEDKLTALASLAPEDSRLSGRPNGYLPSRHPKSLANTIAGHAASVHPALRPASQTEDFSE